MRKVNQHVPLGRTNYQIGGANGCRDVNDRISCGVADGVS
jgi:hypothetical protein